MSRIKGSWRANLVLALVAILFATAIALGGAEAAVRIRERNRTTVPALMAPLYYPHERVRQALVRNSSYFNWAHINGQGFRGTREVGPKERGKLRIITVGESTTFDSNVTGDEFTWSARLEHWMSQSSDACNVEVLNAGVPGYRVLDNVIRLHTELLTFDPDAIVVYHPNNDLFLTIRNPEMINDSDRPAEALFTGPTSRWLSRNSLLYGKLKSRMSMQRGREDARNAKPLTASVVESGVRKYQDELATFFAIAQSRNVKVFMVQAVHVSGGGATTEPDSLIRRLWKSNFPRIEAESLLATYQRFHEGATETATRFGVTVIPTKDFGLRGTQWYSQGDPIHFNNAGADRMAQNLAPYLTHMCDAPTD
jgi:lysophospholipase L1-like esterase